VREEFTFTVAIETRSDRENDRVENCEIRRFAERIKTYQPAIRLEGDGNAAVSNYIHDAPHSAIIYNGNDQLVEANHISDVVLESDDAGAIYTGRDWTARGSGRSK